MQTDRDRETDRQTDKQADRQTDRQKDRQTDRDRERIFINDLWDGMIIQDVIWYRYDLVLRNMISTSNERERKKQWEKERMRERERERERKRNRDRDRQTERERESTSVCMSLLVSLIMLTAKVHLYMSRRQRRLTHFDHSTTASGHRTVLGHTHHSLYLLTDDRHHFWNWQTDNNAMNNDKACCCQGVSMKRGALYAQTPISRKKRERERFITGSNSFKRNIFWGVGWGEGQGMWHALKLHFKLLSAYTPTLPPRIHPHPPFPRQSWTF